jgi:hypothetical protein
MWTVAALSYCMAVMEKSALERYGNNSFQSLEKRCCSGSRWRVVNVKGSLERSSHMWARKVFCEKCGAQIDTLVSPKKESSAIGEAMTLGDSRREHYEATGCPGDHRGWQFGPWEVVPENKPSTEGDAQ